MFLVLYSVRDSVEVESTLSTISLGNRLRQARKAKRLTLEDAAHLVGRSRNTIWRWEKDRNAPSAKILETLATVYARPPDWFVYGNLPSLGPIRTTSPSDSSKYPKFQVRRPHRKERERLPGMIGPIHTYRDVAKKTPEDEPDGMDGHLNPVAIDEVVVTSAFTTFVYTEAGVKRRHWFEPQLLLEHSIDPTQCIMLTVQDEAMVPTLPHGCTIMVDLNRRELREHSIYAMETEAGVESGRVAKLDGSSWIIYRDNAEWPPTLLTGDKQVLGEVVWVGTILVGDGTRQHQTTVEG